MYSQLTTGSKTHVISKIKSDNSAVHVDLGLDTRKNKATKSNEIRDVWFEDGEEVVNGLKIKTVMKAKYQRGRQSVHQYLRMTSIVNPHATIQLTVRDGDGEIIDHGHWIRTTEKLPRVVEEIKPHPHGIHLGQLQRLLKEADERKLTSFLRHNFSCKLCNGMCCSNFHFFINCFRSNVQGSSKNIRETNQVIYLVGII